MPEDNKTAFDIILGLEIIYKERALKRERKRMVNWSI
jgi:hypothetical protein